ncbi:MAG TPA: hypothetical protein VIE44_17645 [Methylomirabilota bacterium]|jgi:hypothetical protein
MSDAGREIGREAGTSPARERRWGLLGGTLGALYGVGAALIAVLVEGAPWWSPRPYPEFFATPRLLAFDVYLCAALVTGVGFLVLALVLARVSRYPRTDASGALILGIVLGLTSGAVLCVRLLTVARGG